MNKLKLTLLIIIFFSSGCVTSSAPEQRKILEQKREEKTLKVRQNVQAKGVKVTKLVNKNYGPRTNTKDIWIYYIDPNKIHDRLNRQTYIMGPYNELDKPVRQYIKIAKITIGKGQIEDQEAMTEMIKIASEIGGDAIIDIYREPVAGGTHAGIYENIIFGSTIKMDVAGFIYKGIVIRYKDSDITENKGDISTGEGLHKTEGTIEREKLYKGRRGIR